MPAQPDAASRLARRMRADRRGSIAVITAISILMLMSVAALSIDGASLYLTKVKNQQIADQAATVAAFAYVQSSNSASVAQAGASSSAVANGAGAAVVAASMVASPLGDGMTTAMVTVTSTVTLRFAPLIGIKTANVSAVGYAELHAGTPCVIGLVRGVTVSANTSSTGGGLTATGCGIGSNSSVYVQNNATATVKSVYATTTIVTQNGGTLTTSPTANQIFAHSSAQQFDPYAGRGVFAGLAVVSALTAPSFPSVGSAPSGGSSGTTCTIGPGTYTTILASCTAITFSGGGAATNITGAFAKSAGTTSVTFNAGTYNFAGGIKISGSATVTMSFSGASTLNVWNGLSLGGTSKLTVTSSGGTTYDIQGGISNNSTKALTFANSGSGMSAFNVAGGIAVLSGSATFPGGSYTVTSGDGSQGAGIDVDGNATVSFGNGDFDLANGIYVGSGSLTIGNGASASSVFQIPSMMTTGTAACTTNTHGQQRSQALDVENGATLTLGAFTYFEINGSVELDGGANLGGGEYYVEGTLYVGQCGSANSTINATGVSMIVSSWVNFGANLTSISLSAQAVITSATDGLPETIVLASQTVDIDLEWGATSAQITGAIYAPTTGTRVEVGSGSVIQDSGCLMLVSDYVVINAASTVGTSCPNLTATPATTSVTLIQ